MKLALSDEDVKFRDELREFFTTQIPAEIRERARTDSLNFPPDDAITTQRILNKAGLGVPNWPVEWGGGKDWTPPLQRQIWADEMRMACVPPEPLAFNASMVGPVIAHFGSQEIKERFLPPTANLDIWWCQGFSEPEAGSDLAGLRTVAVRDGDEYVINGQKKTWTTLGQFADWIFVLARTNPPDAPPKKQAGISFILVEMNTPGITLRPIKLIDGSYEVNEVFFEDVRVPANQLVGEENQAGPTPSSCCPTSAPASPASAPPSCGSPTSRRTPRRPRSARALSSRTRCSPPRSPRSKNELLALELTQLRVSGDEGTGKPNPASSILKLRGQPAAAGRHRAGRGGRRTGCTAVRRRRRHRLSAVGAACGAEVPELPQDLDLRRKQRGPAHHHLLDDLGTVRTGHEL